MTSLPNLQKLPLLDDCGLRVGDDGIVTDWRDSPAREPRPLDLQGGERAVRHPFSAQDDEILRKWCATARTEALTGNRMFERLEAMRPAHSWQAYQNRWRKSLKDLPALDSHTDRPFPGLGTRRRPGSADGDTHTPPEGGIEDRGDQRDQEEEEEEEGAAIQTYCDQRIETDRVLLDKLNVRDEDELMSLLRQPWLLQIYRDFVHRYKNCSDPALPQLRPDLLPFASHSHHQWKLDHAGIYLSSDRPLASRYTAKAPNTTDWTEDDFDIRFIVQVVSQGSARGEVWFTDRHVGGWQKLAKRALWLLLWFKWLQKSTSGRGREMRRLQQKRERWLAFLQEASTEYESPGSLHDGSPVPRTRNLEQNLYLLSEEARRLYQRNRDTRLSAWGVSASHASSCVLVPAIWSSTEAESIAKDPTSWPTREGGMQRLTMSLGGFTLPWGRAAAWFEAWPRSTLDLQHFLPPSTVRSEISVFHGSHRCHQGLCIVPSHLLYEEAAINLSRCACVTAAAGLRSYGAQIPKLCNRHDPPCFLQLAALTTFECLAIQSNIVHLARDLPARPPLPRPAHHPAVYTTFHQGPAPSSDFPDVGMAIDEIVRLPGDPVESRNRRFLWDCAFCSYTRTFQRVTTYWAHLKADHQEVPKEHILAQITASARANQAWAEERFFNYARDNVNTWQKIQQAQAADFSWDTFTSWRLTRERMYNGRSHRRMWFIRDNSTSDQV